MKIELTLLIGIAFAFIILLAILIDLCATKKIVNVTKKIHLERKTCDVCASVFFFSIPSKFWRCSLCGSMNKEK
ncbi:MAG: hypothetical protein PHQ96_09615 [Candidatus Omnitrophica bacterium]|nr:hypothetical protein [Candidatus Omnitrophota bacterium]